MKAKLLTVLLAGVLVFGLALGACGKKDAGAEPAADGASASASEAGGGSESGAGDAEEADAPMSDDMADAVLQGIVEETQGGIAELEELSGGTMGVEIGAEGHALVYTFAFKVDIGDGASAIDSLITEQEAAMVAVADQMKAFGIADAKVVVRFVSMDGKLISEHEYAPTA